MFNRLRLLVRLISHFGSLYHRIAGHGFDNEPGVDPRFGQKIFAPLRAISFSN